MLRTLQLLSIKMKLILLGVLALAALSGFGILQYSGGKQIISYNDKGRVTQTTKIMTTRLNIYRKDLLTDFYRAMMDRAGGALQKDTLAALTTDNEKVKDMTDRVIGRNLRYLDLNEVNKGLKIGEEIAKITQQDLPKLIQENAPDEAFVKMVSDVESKVSALASIHTNMDDAVANALSENADKVKELVDQSNLESEVVGGITLTLLSLVLGLLILSITRSLSRMTGAMNAIAHQKFDTVIPNMHEKTELGTFAAALNVFKQNMIESDRLRAEDEKNRQAENEKLAAMTKITAEFEVAVGGVVRALASEAEKMQTAAKSMSASSEETSRQAIAVATASEQASSNVQTVASAARELTASVSEISQQVSNSSRSAHKAVEEAARTDVTVQGLVTAVQKIGDVVALINDIASQTNLLALNATIEAARAGDAGKGFAVVATEVKALATQTARATEEISQQIAAIQSSTGDAVGAIKGIGLTISGINEIATTIAAAVEEQGAATQEIARNVSEAAQGTSQVSSNITGVTQSSGQTGVAAGQVLGAADDLAKQAETLRLHVDHFLVKVRAA